MSKDNKSDVKSDEKTKFQFQDGKKKKSSKAVEMSKNKLFHQFN